MAMEPGAWIGRNTLRTETETCSNYAIKAPDWCPAGAGRVLPALITSRQHYL